MKNMNLKTSISLALFFFLASFLIMINYATDYQAKISFIALPKKDFFANNFSQVSENIIRLPYTTPFINGLLSDNPGIVENSQNLRDENEKNLWKSRFEIAREGGSGIFKISFKGEDKWQSEKISKESATRLIFLLSEMYDIKNEMSFRIIEGPFSEKIPVDIWKTLLESLATGALLGTLSYLTFFFYKKQGEPALKNTLPFTFETRSIQKEETPLNQNTDGQKKDIQPEPPYIFAKMSKRKEQLESPKKNIENKSLEKKSFAPGNLPVADDSIVKMFGAEKNGLGYKTKEDNEQKNDPPKEIGSPKPLYKEATPEEVKERLNRLLSGSL